MKTAVKPQFRTPYNYAVTAASYEPVSSLPVQTVPGMTPNLMSLLQRRDLGGSVPMFNRSNGYSDEDYPDLHQMDDLEILTYRLELAEHMQELNRDIHDASKELERRSKLPPTPPEEKPLDTPPA